MGPEDPPPGALIAVGPVLLALDKADAALAACEAERSTCDEQLRAADSLTVEWVKIAGSIAERSDALERLEAGGWWEIR